MDFSQLRAFVAIAAEGNLTRAAERLHLTQPAVSLQLKALQSTLGLQLFTRTSTGIGTILDPEFIRLGAFLKRLVESYPQISTRLQHGMSGSVLQQVRSGALDAGFYLGTPGKEYDYQVLTSFNYYVLAPHGWKHRVAGRNWAALAKLPWIWTPPESAHNRLLSKVFASHKVTPHKVALVDQEPSMLDLVKSGVGLALVRESIALREAHAHGLVIADQASVATELSFICQAKRRSEPLIEAVFALLKSVWDR